MTEILEEEAPVGTDRGLPIPENAPVLVVNGLVVEHRNRTMGEVFRAVDGVSLRIGAGESAVVGESGAGKTPLRWSPRGLGPAVVATSGMPVIGWAAGMGGRTRWAG